jgi:hypothetical protein
MSAQVFAYPLTIPLLAVIAGGIAGFVLLSKRRREAPRSKPLLAALVAVALGAALMPFAGQLLYDIGLSESARQAVTYVSYAFVGFGMVGAWLLLHPAPLRWLLIALVPISLFNAASWAFAYYIWDTRGIGP